MRALVLGGCGFIGSHIVDALKAQGMQITVFDRAAEQFRAPVPGVEYVFGDFFSKMDLAEVVAGKDIVFHLISTTVPGTSNLDPKADVSGNLIGTLTLLELMVAQDVRRIVYLSSGGTVYGAVSDTALHEDRPLNPISSYGIVKAAVERYLDMYRLTHGLQPIAIRAANPFGPRQGHAGVQGVIATFMRHIHDGTPIEIWGDGQAVRDYLYVSDLADVCVAAAQSEFCGPINAGSGAGRSLLDIVQALSDVTGQTIAPVFKPGRKLDVPFSVLDIGRAHDVLQWQPQTPFHDGLQRTWEWMQTTR